MKSTRWFLIIAVVYILGFFAHALYLQKTVYGDGIYYYSWVRSIVVDRNINFSNEYKHFGVTAPTTPKGMFGNKHPIGAPFFWLPWYAQAHATIRGSGYELPYQLLVGFTSILAALSGLALLYRLLLSFFSRTTSMLAVVSIALTTNLFFYGSLDPVNSHAVSFFAATVFLSFLFSKNVYPSYSGLQLFKAAKLISTELFAKYRWVYTDPNSSKRSIHPFLTGCALGFCALVRPQDAALGLLAIPRFIEHKHAFPKFILGAILTFSPQLLAWYTLYGSPWTSPYVTRGESFDFLHPHILEVLFSPRNGLFLYSPMLLLGLIGFFFWKHRFRSVFFCAFLFVLFITASWSTWWQGASYSGRMLVSMLPVLSFGLAALFRRLQKHGLKSRDILIILVGPLTILNMLFIFFYLLTG